jgi:hypothetical protein
MSKARKLFQERPENVVEHPTDLGTTDIPEGPLEGWVAFAPRMSGDQSQIIGPFVPTIVKPYEDKQPCIVVVESESHDVFYWFNPDSTDHGRPGVPCWYQSGSTLRFVKKR